MKRKNERKKEENEEENRQKREENMKMFFHRGESILVIFHNTNLVYVRHWPTYSNPDIEKFGMSSSTIGNEEILMMTGSANFFSHQLYRF